MKKLEPPNEPSKVKEKKEEEKKSDEADLLGYTVDQIDEYAETVIKAEEIKNDKELMVLVQRAIDEKAKAFKGLAGLKKKAYERSKEIAEEKA